MTLEEDMKLEKITHRVRIIVGMIIALILGLLWAIGIYTLLIAAGCGAFYLLGTITIKGVDALNKKFGWWK